MIQRVVLGALLALCPAFAFAQSGIELTPYIGYRFGSGFDIRNNDTNQVQRLELRDSRSVGIAVNLDLPEAGKQTEFYFSRQETSAVAADTLLSPASSQVDLVIYQAQFGGLYFPGGMTTGGFASGVIGVTRLEPRPSGLRTHHRASITLGGGYKQPLNRNLLLRFDLRGIYTALDSGGSIFCSGGCTARFESSGYFQAEASAGLAFRF
ncbi:MAG: hypothetical protein LAT63_10770 [Marinobacter sp.]|nr:hypothetical protein [Marinobacter sp.]